MGQVNLRLTDKYEEKLRNLAEIHKRSLAKEVEYGIDLIEERDNQ